MSRIHLAAIASSLVLIAAIAQPTHAAKPTDPLSGTTERFEAAIARGDAPALTDMFTSDGELMPPNGPRITGRAAILAFAKGFMAAKMTVHDVVLSSRVQGDVGVKTGDYVFRDASGKDVDHGKWIEVWRRENGHWRISHDIWNSDMAAATVEP